MQQYHHQAILFYKQKFTLTRLCQPPPPQQQQQQQHRQWQPQQQQRQQQHYHHHHLNASTTASQPPTTTMTRVRMTTMGPNDASGQYFAVPPRVHMDSTGLHWTPYGLYPKNGLHWTGVQSSQV